MALITSVCSTPDELLPAFLEWVSHRPEDPFESQLVIVPNIGMAEYLDAAIRDTHGISANIEFAFTGAHAGQRGFPVEVQHEGHIRQAIANSEGVDARGVVGGNTAGDSLINGGRIKKSVTDHDAASLEGGKDFFANELRAARCEQQ